MKIMAVISELHGKSISGALTEIYWQTLKEFEWQDVERAFQSHIHNPDCGQYFPKPADIVRFIEGNGETKALQAWAKVEHAIHQVGRYESLSFDDPLIHAVLEDMGGWIKLCSVTLDELPFRANEFQKRYMGFVIKKPNRHPRYLCGIAEGENAKNGYAVKPPLLIGDPKKAEQVMISGGGQALSVQESYQPISVLIQHCLPSTPKEGNA
jgi:hypothetical protein